MLSPSDWSVVVVGHWNRAILQPAGIAHRVFGLDPNTPINVDIPLDSIAPFRVRHDEIIASVPANRLILELETCSFELLEKARTYAASAIKSLPETPFTAAGVNMKFLCDSVDDAVQEAATSPLLGFFAGQNLAVSTRSCKCRAPLGSGTMQVKVVADTDQGAMVHFNYELVSGTAQELRKWLGDPLDEAKSFMTAILKEHFTGEDQE